MEIKFGNLHIKGFYQQLIFFSLVVNGIKVHRGFQLFYNIVITIENSQFSLFMKNTNYYLLVSNSFDVLMKLELVTCTFGFREISFSSLYPLPSWPFPSLFPLSCPDSSFSAVLLTLTHNGVTAVVLRPQPLSTRVILQGVRGVSLSSPILPHPVIMSLYRASLLDIPQYLTLSFWSHCPPVLVSLVLCELFTRGGTVQVSPVFLPF